MQINLVVFDFDGTLSSHDANMEFGKYCLSRSLRPWLFLPLIGLAVILKKFKPSGTLWRQMMRRFLTKNMVKKYADDFVIQHNKNRFGWVAERIKLEKSKKNTRVILISASPDYLIHKLVRDLKFDAVICSQMYLARPWKYKFLCWGNNKVVAMNRWLKSKNYTVNFVRSYSDNISDAPIMSLAKEQIWIDPKTGIRVNKKAA